MRADVDFSAMSWIFIFYSLAIFIIPFFATVVLLRFFGKKPFYFRLLFSSIFLSFLILNLLSDFLLWINYNFYIFVVSTYEFCKDNYIICAFMQAISGGNVPFATFFGVIVLASFSLLALSFIMPKIFLSKINI